MKTLEKRLVGILAIALVFGMAVVGCDNGNGGGSQTFVTVTFNTHGGSSAASQAVDAGTVITLPSTTRSGFTFNGWFTSQTGGTLVGNAGGSYTVNSNVTLHAQWTSTTVVWEREDDRRVTLRLFTDGTFRRYWNNEAEYRGTYTIDSDTYTFNYNDMNPGFGWSSLNPRFTRIYNRSDNTLTFVSAEPVDTWGNVSWALRP